MGFYMENGIIGLMVMQTTHKYLMMLTKFNENMTAIQRVKNAINAKSNFKNEIKETIWSNPVDIGNTNYFVVQFIFAIRASGYIATLSSNQKPKFYKRSEWRRASTIDTPTAFDHFDFLYR